MIIAGKHIMEANRSLATNLLTTCRRVSQDASNCTLKLQHREKHGLVPLDDDSFSGYAANKNLFQHLAISCVQIFGSKRH